jgi:hypothetical protein
MEDVDEEADVELDEEKDEAFVCREDSLIPMSKSASSFTSSYSPFSYKLFKWSSRT